MRVIRDLGLAWLVVLAIGVGYAADPSLNTWSEFRNGGASLVRGTLPLQWAPDSIAWQHELQGYGQSSPVIYLDRVYVSSVLGAMKDECLVTCFDLKSGKEQWTVKHPAAQKAASNYMASRAAPTPVVDEIGVYAFFESGDCLAIDHMGKLRWHRNLTSDYGKFDNNHGLGASPTQTERWVIINVEHRGPSYLIALDKRDGKTGWKTDRHSSSSWSSPIVVRDKDSLHVIVSSGGTVDGYRADDGRALWSVGGLDGNSVPSPTPAGNRLLVGARLPEFTWDGEAARSNLCIDTAGVTSKSAIPQVAWRASKAISDYASPVVFQQCVYYINKVGVVYCLNVESGEAFYTERLGNECWATPIVSADNIYFFGKDGTTKVVKTGPKFELVQTNALWDAGAPPSPLHYVENNARDATTNASPDNKATGAAEPGNAPGPRGGGRGAGMIGQLMKSDADGDGQLSASEIPSEFKPMMARIDLNSDGILDSTELKAMSESFASRRAGARDGARDPIVYGAAAIPGAIVIRTGTRIYCIQ